MDWCVKYLVSPESIFLLCTISIINMYECRNFGPVCFYRAITRFIVYCNRPTPISFDIFLCPCKREQFYSIHAANSPLYVHLEPSAHSGQLDVTHLHIYQFSKHACRAATPQRPWSPAGQFVLCQSLSWWVMEHRERGTLGITAGKPSSLSLTVVCGENVTRHPDRLDQCWETDIHWNCACWRSRTVPAAVSPKISSKGYFDSVTGSRSKRWLKLHYLT